MPADPLQATIETMKATDDFAGLGEVVQGLFKLPQQLCKVRGNCCRVATFKGLLSYDSLMTLATSTEADAINARDFLTLFVPYQTLDDVKAIAPQFVDDVLTAADLKDNPVNDVGFFHCRFLGEKGECRIHEDRPTGCRYYPFPHENTIFHVGCGFKDTAIYNWQKIKEITRFFEQRMAQMNAEASTLAALQGLDQP
jgi:Fe-S-cluster containining protein